ncbi:MAG: flagellar basal body P-ring protein FlgI [Limnochordia bacterium]
MGGWRRKRMCLVLAATMLLVAGEATGASEVQPEALEPSPAAIAVEMASPLVRIKDIARVQGVRDNQLIGMGLVVGLNGTGDGSGNQANVQMVTNMLQQFGITVDARYMRSRNVAAVVATAALPSFARSGDAIDVTVASMGDARSLQGGLLLQTPLQGADGGVYAVAQGPLVIGGEGTSRGPGQRTHAQTARVPAGAIVEREVPAAFVEAEELLLVLHTPDFATAARVAQAVNDATGPKTAKALDRTAIAVGIPLAYQGNPVEFIAALEELSVTPDAPARVVVNERTGTVIIGAGVRVAPVAVTHGTLRLQIEAPDGAARYTSQGPVTQSVVLSGSTVHDVVAGLNAIGASPRDVISMLQAIRAAGALYGELVVI